MRMFFTALVLVVGFALVGVTNAQQPPKLNRAGHPVSIVRSEATAPITIEYRSSSQWQPVKLEPGKDVSVAGDRIRVSTTRDDKATVTVDLPIQAGKKYRLVWNAVASIWDFSPVS